MTPRAIRLTKEARAVFWPWLVVMSLGATQSLVAGIRIGPVNLTGLTLLGAFIGIPLLATLPFSIEFQHHTLSTLLSQPLDRAKIWADKMLVATTFALSATAMYYLNWEASLRDDHALRTFLPVLIVVTICSAAYWSLVGKSTITGLMLNLMAAGIGIGVLLYSMTLIRSQEATTIALPALSFALVMIWVGRRKFVQFESTGATAGADLMEGSLGRLFRSTRTNVVLNVLRKELRLLAPVWLLSLSSVLLLILLTPIRQMTQGSNQTLSAIISTLAAVLPGIAFQIAPILGATLSVGEERTRGTQIWNLVLPMSIRRQWLLKFISGLLTCLASQALVLLAAAILGPYVLDQQVNLVFNSPSTRLAFMGVSIATFIPAFWSACAVNGTVRASLLTFPIVGLAGVAGTIGYLLGILPPFGLLNNFLIATFHPYPFSGSLVSQQDHHFAGGFLQVTSVLPFILITPVFVVAVAQSYRLFRRDITTQEGVGLRSFVPLLIMSLLAGTSISVAKDFFFRPTAQQQMVLNEVHDGVVKLYIDNAPLDAAHPLQVNPEELAKTTPLSTVTQKWLRGATIAVYPMEPAGAARKIGPKASPYYVSIVFSTGRECRTAGVFWWCLEPAERATFRILTSFINEDAAQSMVISQVNPVLPPGASRSDRSTIVKLKVSIDPSGVVQWAHPISGEEPFTSVAIKAVKEWRFQPIRILGWPAVGVTNVTVTFD